MKITLEIGQSGKTKRIVVDGPVAVSHDWDKAAQQLAPLVPTGWCLLFYRQEWAS